MGVIDTIHVAVGLDLEIAEIGAIVVDPDLETVMDEVAIEVGIGVMIAEVLVTGLHAVNLNSGMVIGCALVVMDTISQGKQSASNVVPLRPKGLTWQKI